MTSRVATSCVSSDTSPTLPSEKTIKKQHTQETWTTRKGPAPTKKTSFKANKAPVAQTKYNRASPSKIVQTPYKRVSEKKSGGQSSYMKLHEARKARLEPHLIESSTSKFKSSSATPDNVTKNTLKTIKTPKNDKTILKRTTQNNSENTVSKETIHPIAVLAKKSGKDVSNMEIFIPKIFDHDWKDGTITPPLNTSSSYKIFTPKNHKKQLAITNHKETATNNSGDFNVNLLDESEGSIVGLENEGEKAKENLSDIDGLLEESAIDEPAGGSQKQNLKFVPVQVDEDEIEEIQTKPKKQRAQRPAKISNKLKDAISKNLRTSTAILVKPKSGRASEKRKELQKVKKMSRKQF